MKPFESLALAAIAALALLIPANAETGYLRVPVSMPATVNGKAVGSVTLSPGTQVEVLRQEGGRSLVSCRAGQTWVGSSDVAAEKPDAEEIKRALKTAQVSAPDETKTPNGASAPAAIEEPPSFENAGKLLTPTRAIEFMVVADKKKGGFPSDGLENSSTTVKPHPAQRLKCVSETKDKVTVLYEIASKYLEPLPGEIPKECIAEFGGTEGPIEVAVTTLTLARPVKFPSGRTAPKGTKVKCSSSSLYEFTVALPDGETGVIREWCVAELGGEPCQPMGKSRPVEVPPDMDEAKVPSSAAPTDVEKARQTEQLEKLTMQEIIDAAKTGGEPLREAIATGEKMRKKNLRGLPITYVPATDILKEMDGPITNEKVSLRPEFEKLGIRSEAQSGPFCAAYTAAKAIEFLDKKDGNNTRPSKAYLVWLGKLGRQGADQDGADPVTIIRQTGTWGVCSEADFPSSKIEAAPSAEVQAKAKTHKKITARGIAGWYGGAGCYGEITPEWGRNRYRILTQLVMHEIKNGRPVVYSARLAKVKEGDYVKNPQAMSTINRSSEAGHVVVLVGYETGDGTPEQTSFDILNSWGEDWGDRGYGKIPAINFPPTSAFSLQLE